MASSLPYLTLEEDRTQHKPENVSVDIETNTDPVSVHVIYDEASVDDSQAAKSLCKKLEESEVSCTNFERDGRPEQPEISRRRGLIMAATWVIVVCSQRPDDNEFCHEESLALHVAIVDKGLQNVLYLLRGDVLTSVAKGFHYILMADNPQWFADIKKMIKSAPESMNEERFIYNFCCAVQLLHDDWLLPIPAVVKWLPGISKTATWKMRLADNQGFVRYTYTYQGDSVKLVSKKDDRDKTLPVNRNAGFTPMNELTSTVNTSVQDGNRPQLEADNLKDVKAISVEAEHRDICGKVFVVIAIALFYILQFGYLAMYLLAVSPLIWRSSDNLRSTFIPRCQLGFMIYSVLVNLCLIPFTRMVKSKELTIVNACQLVFTVACLILHVLYAVDKLPSVVDIPVGIGVFAYAVFYNVAAVLDYLRTYPAGSKCTFFWRVVIFLSALGSLFIISIRAPHRFKEANLTFKTNLVILAILVVSQVGFFKIIVKCIRYFLKLKFNHCKVRAVEVILFLVFLSIWFVPSFLIY